MMVLVLGESEVSSFSLRDIMSMIKFLFYFKYKCIFLSQIALCLCEK